MMIKSKACSQTYQIMMQEIVWQNNPHHQNKLNFPQHAAPSIPLHLSKHNSDKYPKIRPNSRPNFKQLHSNRPNQRFKNQRFRVPIHQRYQRQRNQSKIKANRRVRKRIGFNRQRINSRASQNTELREPNGERARSRDNVCKT